MKPNVPHSHHPLFQRMRCRCTSSHLGKHHHRLYRNQLRPPNTCNPYCKGSFHNQKVILQTVRTDKAGGF